MHSKSDKINEFWLGIQPCQSTCAKIPFEFDYLLSQVCKCAIRFQFFFRDKAKTQQFLHSLVSVSMHI